MDKDVLLFVAGIVASVIGWFMSRKIAEREKNDAAHTAEMATDQSAREAIMREVGLL